MLARTARKLALSAAQPSRARCSSTISNKPPTAVVMMNLGGPQTLKDVEPFLTRLLGDKEIIQLGPLQPYMAPWMAKRRTKEVSKQYEELGGGSPIRRWTDSQGKALTELLDKLCPETAPHKHYISFRYAEPLTSTAIKEMAADGVTRAIAFTQYPQYSCTTTGSSLNELWRQVQASGATHIKWSVIDRWGEHPLLVKAFAKLIREELDHFPTEQRDKVVLVFSAHSIPHRVVNRGDPYPLEVSNTVGRIMTELGQSNPFRLVYQSKVGPLPWLGPQTSEAIDGFHNTGSNNLILIPIAFTSDHIETLYELDITYIEQAKKLGMNVRRCKALNMEPIFLEALADIVSKHIKSGGKHTQQLPLRCPGCTNDHCLQSKQFYQTQ